jgi:hypothetical protein
MFPGPFPVLSKPQPPGPSRGFLIGTFKASVAREDGGTFHPPIPLMKLAQVLVVGALVWTPLAALAQWGRALPAGAPGVPAAGAPGYGAAGRGFNAGGPINHLGPR